MTVDLKINTLDKCPICLEEMDQAEDTQTLKCAHLFHEACIGEWFKNAPTCPLCRIKATDLTPMPRPPEMTFSELMAVPDHQPHFPAQQNDDEFHLMIFAERQMALNFAVLHIEYPVMPLPSLEERLERLIARRPFPDFNTLHIEHLVMPLPPLRERIFIRLLNSPVGRSFAWMWSHFNRFRGNAV